MTKLAMVLQTLVASELAACRVLGVAAAGRSQAVHMPTWPLPEFPEILLEISLSVQIRLSRNFRGNKHIPADGVAGNVRRPSCKHVLVTHTHGTCQIGAQSGTFLKNGTSDLMTYSYSGPEKEPRIVLLDHLHCVHEIEKP